MSLRTPSLLRTALRPLRKSVHHPAHPHNRTATLPPMTKPTTTTPTLTSTPTSTSTTLTPPLPKTTKAPFTPDPIDPDSTFDYPTFTDPSNTSASTGASETYHLHVYAPKRNCHITFARPNGDSIISKSTGDIGIKGAARGSFDAAFQLASHVLKRMQDGNDVPRSVELVLRDFGPGREAFLKALMGREGQFLRGSIRCVTDATRLKFGGTRSRALRRL